MKTAYQHPHELNRVPDEGGHRRGSREFRRIIVALVASSLATFAVLYSVQPLFPTLSQSFRVSPATASLTLSVTTAALAVAIIPFTALSASLGRTRVMTASIVATAVVGLVVPFAPNFAVLLVLRGLQGLALAGLQATAMSYLSEELHRDSLGFGMGLYIAGNGIGGMGGRILVGAVVDVANWRVAIGVVGVLSACMAIVFVTTILPSRRFQPVPLHLPTLARRTVGTFRDIGLIGLYAVGFLVMAGFVTTYNYLGYRLLSPEFGLSATAVGALFVVYIAGTGASMGAGRLVDAFSRKAVLWPSALFTLVGVALMLVNNLAVIILGLIAVTVGFFATHSVASGWVGIRSTTLGVPGPPTYLFCYYLGSSISGTLGGYWYGRFGWSGLSIYLAALSAAAVIISVALRRLPTAAGRLDLAAMTGRDSLAAVDQGAQSAPRRPSLTDTVARGRVESSGMGSGTHRGRNSAEEPRRSVLSLPPDGYRTAG